MWWEIDLQFIGVVCDDELNLQCQMAHYCDENKGKKNVCERTYVIIIGNCILFWTKVKKNKNTTTKKQKTKTKQKTNKAK